MSFSSDNRAIVRSSDSSSSVIIQMKLVYLSGQLANVDQILYAASLGWVKGYIRFWDRLDKNTGFHGNRKHSLTYNWLIMGKTMSPPFLCCSTLKFFVTLFSGTVRPRSLKLGTHVDSGQMYYIYRNQAAAAYLSRYFFVFFSLQFSNVKIFCYNFIRNCEA